MGRTIANGCVVALLLVPTLACAADAADTLYKCVDPAGLTTIQNSKCPKGQTQVWARPTTPDPPPTPEQLAEQQARRDQSERDSAERARRRAADAERDAASDELQQQLADDERAQADAAARRAGVVDAKPATPADAGTLPPNDAQAILDEQAAHDKQCEDAKQFAIDVRAKPWLDLDDAQWQHLYGWVLQACRTAPRR